MGKVRILGGGPRFRILGAKVRILGGQGLEYWGPRFRILGGARFRILGGQG